MEIGDTKIPDEMLDAANNEFFKAASRVTEVLVDEWGQPEC
ncbi:MAG: hypothetical protein WCA89_10450 [Terracidiphilus sp.]